MMVAAAVSAAAQPQLLSQFAGATCVRPATLRCPDKDCIGDRVMNPGNAQVFVYPNCTGGRVVADVVRLEKGHTEALVKLMVSAPGGKIAQAR